MTTMSGGPSVELLADHPDLIPSVGRMRWQEWGYGVTDPDSWIDATAQESGRDALPITLVAVDAAGDAAGAVALGDFDGELSTDERQGRAPWVLGMVVRGQDRQRNVGRLLLSSIEHLAADWGHEQVWVATGDDAVGFYRQCGWQDAERLRLVSTGILTTILTKEV